jgi:CDP-paratose 2-epimerase
MRHEYVERPREGDHVCYISDLAKLRAHFPGWTLTRSLDDIFGELVSSWRARLSP